LEDCGDVVFEAKLRVMPSCWFLLAKHYVRVDNVLALCREVRYFHKFIDKCEFTIGMEATEIHVEVTWREISSNNPDMFGNTSASSGVPVVGQGSRAPGMEKAFGPPQTPGIRQLLSLQGKSFTHLLPEVNENYGLPKFFSLCYEA
jgi:hypothetical protein